MTKSVPDFLTCKLGSSKYMSNSVYKFRYPDANMSAPTCVRKYYRSETDVKTQYFHICKDLTSISGGQILHMKESHGGIFGQCRWTGLGLVSVNGLSCQDRCTWQTDLQIWPKLRNNEIDGISQISPNRKPLQSMQCIVTVWKLKDAKIKTLCLKSCKRDFIPQGISTRDLAWYLHFDIFQHSNWPQHQPTLCSKGGRFCF